MSISFLNIVKNNFYYIIILLTMLFLSCEDILKKETSSCLDGNCDATFVIDTTQNPGSYLDNEKIWHIKYSGLNYFRIKGNTDILTSEYVINGVPLMETGYDSNYFYIPGSVVWKYPVYSYLGLFINNNLTRPIPVGYQTYTIQQLVDDYSIMNLAGYEISKKFNFNTPYASSLLQTYSKYNYHPTQQMVFFKEMIGDEAEIYIRVIWGETEEKNYTLKVHFEK
jgi:hypothetical protein